MKPKEYRVDHSEVSSPNGCLTFTPNSLVLSRTIKLPATEWRTALWHGRLWIIDESCEFFGVFSIIDSHRHIIACPLIRTNNHLSDIYIEAFYNLLNCR